MKPSQAIIRRRTPEAILIILLLAFAPFAVDYFVPSMTRFIPPFMLLLITLLSILNALFVWRTQWLVSKLFSIESLPAQFEFSQQGKRNAEIGAIIGIVISLFMLAIWLRTLL
jgi:hypothetical protein